MILLAAVAVTFTLLLSAFFSGSETALMSVNPYRLRHLEKTNKKAKTLREVISHPERVLGTILTGNVFVNTAAGAALTFGVTLFVASDEHRARAISVATVVLTALILIFGEMVPKSFAARHPEAWALSVIRPVNFLIRLLGPVVALLSIVARTALRIVGEKAQPLTQEVTLEEIKAILYAPGGREDAGGRRQMVRNVIELNERRLREVMIPRTEIIAVDKRSSLEDIVRLIQQRRFSRMPVYDETLDRIIGLVYSKDILTYWGARVPFRLDQVLRKPFFLPDSARVEQALRLMRDERVHLALVVDEHGGLEGLATLEDLLEEIVGELRDEKDDAESRIVPLADSSLLIDGAIGIKELNHELAEIGLMIPELDEYNTLAGFILGRLGHIPVVGEELTQGGWLLSIARVQERRVRRVRARRLD